MEIVLGMCGPPKAGITANNLIAQRLGNHGYYQVKHTPGLWQHAWKPIYCTLVVDNFAIVFAGRDHADHLMSCCLKF